jgi:hypothetical protein
MVLLASANGASIVIERKHEDLLKDVALTRKIPVRMVSTIKQRML